MEIKELAVQNYKELLNEYGYEYNEIALGTTVNQWYNSKENLRSILSKSQYWDEEMQAIVLKEKTIMRSFNEEGVIDFGNWMRKVLSGDDAPLKQFISDQIIGILMASHMEFGDNIIHLEWTKNQLPENIFDHIPELREGQKWSRYIGQLCKSWGVNTITDIQTEIYQDSNTGELHKRQKDYGYNHHFALLGDSCNPLAIKHKTFVLSLNLLDYLTMSFGHDWASCHSIDKSNTRDCNGNYSGQYSAGTLSYGLDDVTMIAYITDELNPNRGRNIHHHYGSDVPYWKRDKEHRAVVSWGEDKLYFGRTYPDDRDNGDASIAGQIREIVQQIFAECLGVSNIWVTKKGTENTSNYVGANEGNCAYDDWACYDKCSISFLKTNGTLNTNMIYVGTYPICPTCGHTHENSDSIQCEDCSSGFDATCPWCGDGFVEEDGVYVEPAERTFCCSTCASDAGWHIDHYGNWIHINDAIWISDTSEWYPADDDDIALCEDDGCWHLKNDCYYDEHEDEWYSPSYDGVVCYDGTWYHNEDTATAEGYVWCDDDREWHHVAD